MKKVKAKNQKSSIENISKSITSQLENLENFQLNRLNETRTNQEIDIAVLDSLDDIASADCVATFRAIQKITKIKEEHLSDSLARIMSDNFGLRERKIQDAPEGLDREYYLVRI